jgi:hypothetical protein
MSDENKEIVEEKRGRGRPRGDSGPNKSELIRNYLTDNPNASAKEIISDLSEKDIEVSQALIGTVKSKGELIDGTWQWNSTKKSKRSEVVELKPDDIRSMQDFFEKFSSNESMDPIEIIDSLTEEIEKVGYNKFKKAFELLKENISDEDDDEISSEIEEEEISDEISSESDEDDEIEGRLEDSEMKIS